MLKKWIAFSLALALVAGLAALAEEPVAAPVDEAPSERAFALTMDAGIASTLAQPDDNEAEPTPTAPPSGALVLSADALTLGVGEGAALTCSADGAPAECVFTSSNEAVASVDRVGNVTGVAVGTATVTATALDGRAAACAVSVLAAPTAIKLNAKSATLGYDADSGVGMSFQIEPKLPAGSASAIAYGGYDAGVIEVTSRGRILPRGVGKTKVTVSTYNQLTAKITVRVLPAPTAFSLNVSELNLRPKDTYALKLVLPDDTAGCFGFQSDDTDVAKVDAVTGVVTAVGYGEATVTATCFNGAYAACAVNVLAAPSKIELAAKKATIGVGERFSLDAKPVGKDGSPAGGAVKYSSSKSKVASVSADGVVTGKKFGSATITVTCGKVKAKCAVKVAKAPGSVQVAAANPKLLAPGKSTSLKVTLPKDTASAIAYSGYDEGVVKVSAAGKVTAVGPGATTITATTFNGKTARCAVRVLAEGQPRAVNVAHRGGAGYWPENTLEAFQNTASTGAAAVELDARTTLDGVQVVHHDSFFKVNDEKVVIKDMTYDALRALKPSLCTLDEALAIIAGTNLELNLELKDTADPQKCVDAVHRCGLEGRTLYISFVAAQLSQVRKIEPSARIGFIINDTPADLGKTVAALGAESIFQWDKYLTKANLIAWQNKGLLVGVWTVDDAKSIAKWLDMGVDYLTSNYPKLTAKAL